jgi:hypothetical protein
LNLGFLSNLNAGCEFEYTISNDAAQKIAEIVTTVAHTRPLSLWGKEKHLRKLGDEVDKEVAFFVFWAYVFSDSNLTKDMKMIRGSSLKYNSFISGGRKEILEEYNQNKDCFLKKCEGFANYLKLNSDELVPILKKSLADFEKKKTGLKPFFDYLIENKMKELTESSISPSS